MSNLLSPFPLNAQRQCWLFTTVDKWLIGVCLLIGLLLWPLLSSSRGAGTVAVIEINGRLYARCSLSIPTVYHVPGVLGDTVVEIKSGAVRVVSSPCPEKRCIHSGPIQQRRSLIVCVPNRVVVRIPGEPSESLDLITE